MMEEKEASLLRSKLHIRAGKKLLDHNKIIHAIGTLYDAVEFAMRYYYLKEVDKKDKDTMYDAIKLANYLSERCKEIPENFDFQFLHELMETSLNDYFEFEDYKVSKNELWEKCEKMLRDLQVYPFDFSELPEEDERTREIMNL